MDWGNATSFPQALNLGCTFNRTAIRAVGRQIGREMRALQNVGVHPMGLTSWSPTINIIRVSPKHPKPRTELCDMDAMTARVGVAGPSVGSQPGDRLGGIEAPALPFESDRVSIQVKCKC